VIEVRDKKRRSSRGFRGDSNSGEGSRDRAETRVGGGAFYLNQERSQVMS